jgi:hypothetical protein
MLLNCNVLQYLLCKYRKTLAHKIEKKYFTSEEII